MKIKFHPRAWIDSVFTYPRFIGTIKPRLLGTTSSEFQARLSMYETAWWPRQLKVPVAKRILALSPHPDDESIGCGGFLLAHAGKASITIVNVYNGDGGGALEGEWTNDADYKARLVEVRARELDEAAAMLKAQPVIRFGVSDCDGRPGRQEAKKLERILHGISPEVILLPWMLDEHPHHKMTNRLFAEAAQGLNAMVLGYEIWKLLIPNSFFDFTEMRDRKLELISKFVSQLRTVDYGSYADALGRMRAFHLPITGRRTGSVEAFIALPCQDYCDLVLSTI